MKNMKDYQKIAIICLTSQRSGWSDHFATICHGLKSQQFSPIEIFTSRAAKDSFTEDEFNKINFVNYDRKSPILSLFTVIRLAFFFTFRRFRTIIIYGESIQHCMLIMFTPSPIVAHIADPIPHEGVSAFQYFLTYLSKRFLIKRSKKLFVASQAVRQQLVESQNTSLSEIILRKTEVVKFANLIQISNQKIQKFETKEFLWDFIYFGRIEPYKGLADLFAASNLMRASGVPFKCLIVSRNAHNVDLPEGFSFISKYLEFDELGSLVRKSRYGVFPYRDATGTHTVQICNFFGTPIVAPNIGSFRDYVKPGLNGFLFEAKNIVDLKKCLTNALANPNSCKRGAILNRWAKGEFSNEQSTRQLIHVIQNV